MKLKHGDKLFCTFSNRRSSEYVTIENVGRKWLHLSNGYRADIDTLMLDGGNYSSPGACWLSQEEYELSRELDRVWNEIRRDVEHFYRCPSHMTMTDLRVIQDILAGEKP